MKKSVILLGFILLLASCKSNRVIVTLENASKYEFKKITVKLGDTIKTFENLKQGDKTIKFITNATYSYGKTTIILINNDTLMFEPADYIGEKFYKRGKIKIQFYLPQNHTSKAFSIRSKAKRQL